MQHNSPIHKFTWALQHRAGVMELNRRWQMEQATHRYSLFEVRNKWQVEYHVWNKVQETKSTIHQSMHFTLSFNKRRVGSGMRRKRQKAQFDNWPISAWELTLLRRRALWFPSSASPRTLRPPEHSHPAHVPQISQAPSTKAQTRIEHTSTHIDSAKLPDPPLWTRPSRTAPSPPRPWTASRTATSQKGPPDIN